LNWNGRLAVEGSRLPRVMRLNSKNKMKPKLTALSRRYATALRRHLDRGARAIVPRATALDLGRRAVALDLETLDVAGIHDAALAAMESTSSSGGTSRRAEAFFAEVIAPIEKTHRAALRSNLRLSRLGRTLRRRTVALAASNRSLKRDIVERRAAEQALRNSGKHSRKLLSESRELQRHLQRLAHRILSAHEDKRQKISRDLHDEIAQTLLGINVRLLTLKREAEINAHGLKKDIASTQRLVDKSVKSIKRFAREFGIHNRT
jgi:signal transduction histidine kinase